MKARKGGGGKMGEAHNVRTRGLHVDVEQSGLKSGFRLDRASVSGGIGLYCALLSSSPGEAFPISIRDAIPVGQFAMPLCDIGPRRRPWMPIGDRISRIRLSAVDIRLKPSDPDPAEGRKTFSATFETSAFSARRRCCSKEWH
jgi:hypothetical protein